MVLSYMVSDTDLAKGELRQPEMEVEQTRRRAAQPAKEDAQPKRSMTSSIKSVNLKLLLMVIVILGIAVYYIWTADLISPILESLPINNKDVVVTSIVYSEENASAMVSDRIVYEGDMIDGYKVVKIHRDKVEFEKNGKIFTKQVNK